MGVTELVLSRSRYTGDPVRLNSGRDLLARAIGLGFRDLEIQNARSPISVRDSRRVYVWQPLDHESAIEPTEDVTRIESCPDTPGTAPPAEQVSKASGNVNERTTPARNGTKSHPPSSSAEHVKPADTTSKADDASNGQSATENAVPTGLAALIQEAEALHEVLADAKTRAARLIDALRRHRKQSRLVQETLRSLRQLQDVAE